MSVPAELRYTPEHEWVSVEGTSASVGITEYAAQQLGDVVYVSLPAPGYRYAIAIGTPRVGEGAPLVTVPQAFPSARTG